MLRGTWHLPRPGIKPVSLALAGRFFTTEPPGKPCHLSLMAEVVRQNTYTVGKHSVFSHRGIGKVTLEHGESESGSVMSDSSRPHGRYSPWNSPGRILEWVAFPFSRGSSQPRDQTGSRALQAGSLPVEPQGKPKNIGMGSPSLLQWIFLTQESNWGLLHCKLILYQLSYQGAWNMVRSA